MSTAFAIPTLMVMPQRSLGPVAVSHTRPSSVGVHPQRAVYDKYKAANPDKILLFECGCGSYNAYYDDAEAVADVIGVLFTANESDDLIQIHLTDKHLDRNVDLLCTAGFTVALLTPNHN